MCEPHLQFRNLLVVSVDFGAHGLLHRGGFIFLIRVYFLVRLLQHGAVVAELLYLFDLLRILHKLILNLFLSSWFRMIYSFRPAHLSPQ